MQKNRLVDNILRNNPENSQMVIDGMKNMPSADQSENDPQKIFSYLHSVTQYVTNFFKNPNSDPNTFGPPSPPNSVQLSKDDLNAFTIRAVNFVSDNWAKLQSQEIVEGNIKKDLQSQKDMEITKNKVLVNLEVLSQLSKEQVGAGLAGPMIPGNMNLSTQGLKEGAMGFLKGGKVGAVAGYVSGASKDMSKRFQEIKQEKMDTRENFGEKYHNNSELEAEPTLRMR